MFIKEKNKTLNCLACGKGFLESPLFKINDLPLVDKFMPSYKEAREVFKSDVTLRKCSTCETVQIDNPISPSILYDEYIYESSSSPDLNKHFDEYSEDINNRFNLNDSKILEIGINDGLLAKKLLNKGSKNVCGIDPSPQSKKIEEFGIEIINGYFGSNEVNKKMHSYKYDLIIANNVLSHIPQMFEIIQNISSYLKKGGTLIFEVQSLTHMLRGIVFDYIYHEHIFYHSLISLDNLLNMAGLEIYDVSTRPVKGGSYRIFASHKGDHMVNTRVIYEKYQEDIVLNSKNSTWLEISKYLQIIRGEIDLYTKKNSLIVGYGACATGTVLQRYFNLESKIKYVIDDNAKRQGLFTPGYGIEVTSDQILDKDPNIIILAWRHLEYFKKKLSSHSYFKPLPYPLIR